MNFQEFKNEHAALTEANAHTEAAKLLINRFGTFEQRIIITAIAKGHKRRGYITEAAANTRDSITRQYSKCLKA